MVCKVTLVNSSGQVVFDTLVDYRKIKPEKDQFFENSPFLTGRKNDNSAKKSSKLGKKRSSSKVRSSEEKREAASPLRHKQNVSFDGKNKENQNSKSSVLSKSEIKSLSEIHGITQDMLEGAPSL